MFLLAVQFQNYELVSLWTGILLFWAQNQTSNLYTALKSPTLLCTRLAVDSPIAARYHRSCSVFTLSLAQGPRPNSGQSEVPIVCRLFTTLSFQYSIVSRSIFYPGPVLKNSKPRPRSGKPRGGGFCLVWPSRFRRSPLSVFWLCMFGLLLMHRERVSPQINGPGECFEYAYLEPR